MQDLNPLTLPLNGRRLIEASAGTGKTFTIALLYLRLILERGLEVPEILVVTFTNSATEELRGRIRSRLHDALTVLEGENQLDDPLLTQIVTRITDKAKAKTILSDSLTRMDEAAIFTIHGFCQRMLQENAFETAGFFDIDFLDNETELRLAVIEDFWRMTFYHADYALVEWVAAEWKNPAGLLAEFSGPLARPDVQCIPEVDDKELDQLYTKSTLLFNKLQQHWLEKREAVSTILQTDTCLSRDKSKGYGQNRVTTALSGMEQLVASENMAWLLPDCIQLFAESFMNTRLKKKCEVTSHPFFSLFDSFYTSHTEFIRQKRIHLLQQVRKFLFTELTQRKQKKNALFFDDLLSQLHNALTEKGNLKLVKRIRKRFPVAMVDEFQDTDPQQYAIFNRIYNGDYGGDNRRSESGLFMIGDPKQAIYSFRGADIFTYIGARRETVSRFTLDTNYRSTSKMVDAVNALFQAENSFIFTQDIRYQAVKSGSTADSSPLILEGDTPTPLAAWLLPLEIKTARSKTIAKDKAGEVSVRLCANEVTRLLNLGVKGKAYIGKRPLVAGDLTILVRTHREADLMQSALSSLGVASVYYSRNSVFATDEALQIGRLLSSLLTPGNESLMRTALTTDYFGLDGNDIDTTLRNENVRENRVLAFREYHDLWQQKGVAVMLQHLLTQENVVQRLTALPSGERRLTNFLHLGELLQEQFEQTEGMDDLLRWFSTRCHDPKEAGENEQLRLESDEELVKIVTIHKSKGLEYNIVFLPFIWSCRTINPTHAFTFHDPDTLSLFLSMTEGSDNSKYAELAEQERLAEDLRLLYVAITRAKHRCYFGWGQISGADKSALAFLLHPATDTLSTLSALSDQDIRRDMDHLNKGDHLIEILDYTPNYKERYVHDTAQSSQITPKIFKGVIRDTWRITSYSQLASGMAHRPDRPDYDAIITQQQEPAVPGKNVFSFPKGSHTGTFIHGLLETLDFQSSDQEQLRNLVDSHLERASIAGKWSEVVVDWIDRILGASLNDNQERLCDINKNDQIAELAFYYPLNHCKIAQLNALLHEYGFSTVKEGSSVHLSGLMKGFIDLVFRHNGKYYLADYKSNHLGNSFDFYTQEKLVQCISEHRYDLQYLIYTLALNRYLGTRIPDYSYKQHFGGVYYLFLRGMHQNPALGKGIFSTRPPEELIKQFDKMIS